MMTCHLFVLLPAAGYEDYFSDMVDIDACLYMMLANEMTHHVLPSAITIAEDVSGMPGGSSWFIDIVAVVELLTLS